MTTIKSVHVIISGRVQGVGYRAWCKSNAKKRGLIGWVRNRNDQTVEAILSGKPAQVDAMLEACHDGPLASRVSGVHVTECPMPSDVGGFEQRPTES